MKVLISNLPYTCLCWNRKVFLTSISTRSRSELWHSRLEKASKARWSTTTKAATTAAATTKTPAAASAASTKATTTSTRSFGFCWKKKVPVLCREARLILQSTLNRATLVTGEKRTSFQNTQASLRTGWIITAATTTTIAPWKRWRNKHSYWVLLSHHFPLVYSGLESRETVTLENLELKMDRAFENIMFSFLTLT